MGYNQDNLIQIYRPAVKLLTGIPKSCQRTGKKSKTFLLRFQSCYLNFLIFLCKR